MAAAPSPQKAVPPPPGGIRLGAAVLGATGLVGQRFVERLQDHPWFDLRALVGNESAGHRYGERAKPWLPSAPPRPDIAARRIDSLDDLLRRSDVDVVFSALPSGTAGPIESRLAAAGFAVFSNARDHRMDADVPLLVPEVNPDHLDLVRRQPGPGILVANGNCSSIILELPLAALHRAVGVLSLDVVTMQGLSGAGHPGVSALDASDNVIPYIGGEEEKVELEPAKTLGRLANGRIEPLAVPIRATCTRVPVSEGHLLAVHATLARATTLDEVRSAFEDFRGPPELAACPTAPLPPIHVLDEADRPQPRRDRDRAGGMAVSVGRLRLSADGRTLRFLTLGHNTVRGAAGQSVLNAEFALARGVLKARRPETAALARPV